MKIKGKEIVIIDTRKNEPWPREISIDGERMIFNNAWENTPSGQRIYYKSPDDNSAFQGVGVLRRDLLRVLDAGKQKEGK